jgi:hypothetical protein
MRDRPIVKRLRAYTSALTWAELNSLTKQGVIDAFAANNDPFTTDELIQLDKWGRYAFSFLKNEWLRAQHEDFINTRYIPAFKAAINPSMSSYTVRQVYLYTISEGLSESTAQALHKKAVSMYHGELNG